MAIPGALMGVCSVLSENEILRRGQLGGFFGGLCWKNMAYVYEGARVVLVFRFAFAYRKYYAPRCSSNLFATSSLVLEIRTRNRIFMIAECRGMDDREVNFSQWSNYRFFDLLLEPRIVHA